jgi:hypothetical protein
MKLLQLLKEETLILKQKTLENKDNFSKIGFFINDKQIAYISKTKDYIKAKSTDKLRTKIGNRYYLNWDHQNLSHLFDKIELINYIKSYFRSHGDWRLAPNKEYIISELNNFCVNHKLDFKFS